MPVILVLVIAVVWIAILAPNVMKRRAQLGDGVSSISRFHRQLRVLEHSAPEPIVAPAYRLRAVNDDGTLGTGPIGAEEETPVLTVVGADQLPKPALAFLGRNSEEPVPASTVRRPVATTLPQAPTRQHVRRRRRDTLAILTLVFLTTFLLGILLGATTAWAVCGLVGAALAAYVALLVRLQKVTEERTRKLRYLGDGYAEAVPGGARWRSARFTHPAYQVSAAR